MLLVIEHLYSTPTVNQYIIWHYCVMAKFYFYVISKKYYELKHRWKYKIYYSVTYCLLTNWLLLWYSLLIILSILYMIIFHVCVKSHALKIGLSDRYLWLISMNVYILHYIGSAFFTHGRKTSLVIFNVELQMEHECFISNHRKMLGEDNNTINIKASINSSQTRNVRSTNLKSEATKLCL